MVAETTRGERKPFPEIRIMVTGGRRRRHLVFGPALQAVAVSGLLCGMLALGSLGAGWMTAPRRIVHQEKAARRTEIVNADLQDTVARLQDRLARAADHHAVLKARLSAITGRTGALSDRLAAAQVKLRTAPDPPAPPAADPQRLARLRQALVRVRHDVRRLQAQSATLAARVNKTEAERADQSARTRRYRAGLIEAEREAGQRGGR